MSESTILIVDDIELNRAILAEAFSGCYSVLEAENGLQAQAIVENNPDSIVAVLLDNLMPEMSGFEFLEVMNHKGWIYRIPVVMISSENSEEYVLRGYELGVSDFIARPFNANIVRRRVTNLIELSRHRNQLERLVREQTRRLRESNLFMIDTLSAVVEFRNGESGLHIRHIRGLTELLLREMAARYPEYDLTEKKIEDISNAAALHDIGKIAIPEHILNKPGKLTPEEFEIMKLHTIRGAEMLDNIDHIYDPVHMEYCYNICRYHHERWDGNGYPDGLRGDAIPLCAQVVSLADVYDALTSERVYKPPYMHQQALKMILNNECGVFNPRILDCLMAYSDGISNPLDAILSAGLQLDIDDSSYMP